MTKLVLKTERFHNAVKTPTIADVRDDMMNKIKELSIKTKKAVDVKKSLLSSIMKMEIDASKLDAREQYYAQIFIWECEYNTKVYNPKKLKNNNHDIFTSVHNYVVENKVHYPIYKINGMFEILYKTALSNTIYESSELKASRYKTFNRCAYMVFIDLGALGFIDLDSIVNIENSKTIDLYPFQSKYKRMHPAKTQKYVITETLDLSKYIDDEIGWKYILIEDCCIRIKPFKISYVTSETRLPHQDIMVGIFIKTYKKYYDITIDNTKSYVGFFKIECISKKDYPNHQIFNNLIDVGTDDANIMDIREDNVLSFQYVFRQCLYSKKHNRQCPRYKITDKVMHLFNQKSYTDKFLDSIFNPQRFAEPIQETTNVLLNDTDSESDNDSEAEESEEVLQQYSKFTFYYNKHYTFDKNIIENSIYSLLQTNDKANRLFDLYTDIKVLKPISKCYTDKRYFNIILYNKLTKLVSQSYHAYLDDTNNITSITRIENLI